MKLGIDATNIRGGGGLTHLKELLQHYNSSNEKFTTINLWISKEVVHKLPSKSNLICHTPSELSSGPIATEFWRRNILPTLSSKYDIMFAPGGGKGYGIYPWVTMFQNMLPFDLKESLRYGLSKNFVRLLVLRQIFKKGFRDADGIVFLTEYAKNTIARNINDKLKMSAVIPHGIGEKFFIKRSIQYESNFYNKIRPFHWTYVSILDVYKHQDKVLESIIRLNKKGYPFHLTLIGGSYMPFYQRIKHHLNHKFIKYLGIVDHGSLFIEFQKTDGFIFASSCENLPNILLENMATGRPIVCSKHQPMDTILGQKGCFFDPTNTESIECALVRLFNDTKLRNDQSDSFPVAAKKYKWSKCYRDTMDFLAEVAANSTRTKSIATNHH